MLLISMLLAGCSTSSGSEPDSRGSKTAYWVQRSDAELAAVLSSVCKQSVARNAPVLLTFSAPWCSDCNQLKKLGAEPALAAELEQWGKVVIDVGKFDRHPLLMKHFGVESIAYMMALRPSDCSTEVTSWPLLAAGTFEVASNPNGPRTAADVVGWLTTARKK